MGIRELINLLDNNREAWASLNIRPPRLIQFGFDLAWLFRVLSPARQPSAHRYADCQLSQEHLVLTVNTRQYVARPKFSSITPVEIRPAAVVVNQPSPHQQ